MQRRSAVSTVSGAFTVTTAGIGVITWRASCSCRWKTPDSIPASSTCPVAFVRSMKRLSSSELMLSRSPSISMPRMRVTTKLEAPFRAQITGRKTIRNQSKGVAARVMATILGACSPTIT